MTSSTVTHASPNDAALLVAVVDINASAVVTSDSWLSVTNVAGILVPFFAAFGLLHRRNEAALVVCSSQGAVLAFHQGCLPDSSTDNNLESLGSLVGRHLLEAAEKLLTTPKISPTSAMSSGLSLALCHINRRLESSPHLKPRILVLQVRIRGENIRDPPLGRCQNTDNVPVYRRRWMRHNNMLAR